jgi:hypothetical protein
MQQRSNNPGWIYGYVDPPGTTKRRRRLVGSAATVCGMPLLLDMLVPAGPVGWYKLSLFLYVALLVLGVLFRVDR